MVLNQSLPKPCQSVVGKLQMPAPGRYCSGVFAGLYLKTRHWNKMRTIIPKERPYCYQLVIQTLIKICPRKEEIFAKRIVYLKLSELGRIENYQVPLKDTLQNNRVLRQFLCRKCLIL